MPYLLDTNILSDLIRFPEGKVAAKIRVVGTQAIRTSIVTAAEMRFGAQRKGSRRLEQRLDQLFKVVKVVPLLEPVDRMYGDIRARLEKAGTLISGNDMLIAAQALVLGDIVVTNNEREFRRVSGLQVENWLR